jgi:uncharacterized membrane protein YeiB
VGNRVFGVAALVCVLLPLALFAHSKGILALGVAGTLARAGILKLPETRSPYLNGLVQGIVDTTGFLAMSFFYAGAITLLAQRDAWKRRLLPLAAVGRMALSNYLFQSLVCTTLFYAYGFRLFGKVAPAAGLGLTFAIYTIQIPLSVCCDGSGLVRWNGSGGL